MSPTLNRSSEIQRFERSDAIEILDGIIFNFYMGLSHVQSTLHLSLLPQEKLLRGSRVEIGNETVHADLHSITS